MVVMFLRRNLLRLQDLDPKSRNVLVALRRLAISCWYQAKPITIVDKLQVALSYICRFVVGVRAFWIALSSAICWSRSNRSENTLRSSNAFRKYATARS